MTKKYRYRSPYKNTEDYLKRLSDVEAGTQRRINKINQATDKALEKNAIKIAKERIMDIASTLVISNTVSIEEITQLDIQHHTMSEICDLIEESFGKSRLKHIHKDIVDLCKIFDKYVYSGEQIVDLSKITKKQLEHNVRTRTMADDTSSMELVLDEVKRKEKYKENKEKVKKTYKEGMEILKKFRQENKF